MRRTILTCILIISTVFKLWATETKEPIYWMLSGASFAISENTWFEMGCEAFGIRSINKAVGGEAITHTAVDMFNNRFYTLGELDKASIFVIMHVHNQAVANETTLKSDYKDYVESDLVNDYAAAYDYVIKRYQADCLALKDNPQSRYYGSEKGKPAIIVLCTHWHDSRTIYNADVRKLATKWNLNLVKFDDNIGFTKDVLVDGKQPSLQYASDTKTFDGQTYGFHPLRGRNQYIQQKMSKIFVDEMERVVGKILPTVLLKEDRKLVSKGEEANVSFYFLGEKPWNLTYSVNGETVVRNDVSENPLVEKIKIPIDGKLIVKPLSISDQTLGDGVVSGEVTVQYVTKVLNPTYDGYVHQKSADTSYETGAYTQVKGLLGNYSREAFYTFNLNELTDTDQAVIFRTYFYKNVYSGEEVKENHIVEISGMSGTVSGLTWNNKPQEMKFINEAIISPSSMESYISWDITDWVKEQKKQGNTTVTLRLKIADYTTGLLHFYSVESSKNKPQLLVLPQSGANIVENSENEICSYYNPSDKKIYLKSSEPIDNITLFDTRGRHCYAKKEIAESAYEFDVASIPTGIYVLMVENNKNISCHKILKYN